VVLHQLWQRHEPRAACTPFIHPYALTDARRVLMEFKAVLTGQNGGRGESGDVLLVRPAEKNRLQGYATTEQEDWQQDSQQCSHSPKKQRKGLSRCCFPVLTVRNGVFIGLLPIQGRPSEHFFSPLVSKRGKSYICTPKKQMA